jgi:hypothetical protein
MRLDYGREQHVFYRDRDDYIHHIWWSEARGFRHDNWTAALRAHGVQVPRAVGDPAAAVAADQSQHIFYRPDPRDLPVRPGDQPGDIHHIWWSQGGGFKYDNWMANLREHNVQVPPAVGDPAAIGQSIFYRDLAGAINCIVFDTESQSLSHYVWDTQSSPAATDPATLY